MKRKHSSSLFPPQKVNKTNNSQFNDFNNHEELIFEEDHFDNVVQDDLVKEENVIKLRSTTTNDDEDEGDYQIVVINDEVDSPLVNPDQFLIVPSHNLIKEIQDEIILDWMFYMDRKSLFNFIQVCKDIYNIFEEVYSESIERIRIDILNKKRKASDLGRLLDLFSNESSNRNGERVMLTYDQYFRTRSSSSWPSSYFHDMNQFETVLNEDDPQIKLINEKADAQMKLLLQSNHSGLKVERVFPYGIFPQQDLYYLTFNQLVKRRCAKGIEQDLFTYVDGDLKIERVITPELYQNEEINLNVDYHTYVDKHNVQKTIFVERIVRCFKHPYEMTLSDFDNRFKNHFLSELAKLFIYECAFEHNKSTKTKERFVVSGGSLLHNLTGCGCQDIDIFIINNQEPDEIVNRAIKSVLLKFEEKTKSNFTYNIMGSKTTINICEERPKMNIGNGYRVETNQNIQIVLLRYESIEELLLFFDLDCCKIAYDGIRVVTVLECLRALKYKINFLLKQIGDTELNRQRAIKYGCRGFYTFTIDTRHPLSHVMHCDFVVESIRNKIYQDFYYDNNLEMDMPYARRRNPTTEFFVKSNDRAIHSNPFTDPLDLDESNYLYPLILRNVDFHFVELSKSIGIYSALWKLRRTISRERNCYVFDFLLDRDNGNKANYTSELMLVHESPEETDESLIQRIVVTDGYTFLDRPSELFDSLPEDYNFVKEKYSYAHLVFKYNIMRCEKCSIYMYSPVISSICRKRNQMKQEEIKERFLPSIDETCFDPETHLLCENCLKQVNGVVKFKAFVKFKPSFFSMHDEVEQSIVKILQNEDGLSKKKIFKRLKGQFSIEELEVSLYGLEVYLKEIKRTNDGETFQLINTRTYGQSGFCFYNFNFH